MPCAMRVVFLFGYQRIICQKPFLTYAGMFVFWG